MGRFEVVVTDLAQKDIKELSKKYPRILDDLEPPLEELESNPRLGNAVHGYGRCHKLRVASSDIKGGKSRGFRVITLPAEEQRKVYVIWVYAKPVKEAARPHGIERRAKREGL